MSSTQHSVRTRRRRRTDADAAPGAKRGCTLCPQCGERRLPCATCYIGWRVRVMDWPGKPRHSPATSRRPARPRLSACNWRGSDANLHADAEVVAFQPGTNVHKLRLAPCQN